MDKLGDQSKYTVRNFWDRFDMLAALISRYNLPEDHIIEEAIVKHGPDKMYSLIDKITVDVESGEQSIKNPSGLIISTIRGKSKFPPVFKERTGEVIEPNWYKQALMDIEQYEYYVVYDSNDIYQKDMTRDDILSLGAGLSNIDKPLIDTYWIVYGCLKMLRVPSLRGKYPTPELAICKSFSVFNELTSFFRGIVVVPEEEKKRVQAYITKHKDSRAVFESKQPGLIKVAFDG